MHSLMADCFPDPRPEAANTRNEQLHNETLTMPLKLITLGDTDAYHFFTSNVHIILSLKTLQNGYFLPIN